MSGTHTLLSRRLISVVTVAAVAAVLLVVGLLSYGGVGPTKTTAERGVQPQAVAIGVLGDSDSSSYQGDQAALAGTPYWNARLQWTEVLARMRPTQVDLGEWGTWGVPRWMTMARVRDGLGLRWRGPRRVEYRHVLAWSSPSSFLVRGGWRQAERLADVMDEEPARWRNGIVIIRSGVNDFGKESLDLLAVNPADPKVMRQMDDCIANIRGAMDVIRRRHPSVKFVLVGIDDNVNWPEYFDNFRSGDAVHNVSRGLDHFDDALRRIAQQDPHVAFFDERAWFAGLWGNRDAEGRPAYRSVRVGQLDVTNTEGDAPVNAVLANGHAGLAWNVLWVQALIDLVRTRFGSPIDPVPAAEAASFVDARSGP